ncbi:hypothetical protein [Aurantivibrio plasticivorans]
MKWITLIISTLLISGCHLEGNYERDTYFPHIIEFKNANAVDLKIESIIAAPASGSIFNIDSKHLDPGEKYGTRAADQEAQVYRDLNIIITATCKGGNEWSKSGKEVATLSTGNTTNTITILIGGCD